MLGPILLRKRCLSWRCCDWDGLCCAGLYGAVATLSLRFRSNAEDEWSLWLRAAPGSTVKVPFISGIEIYQIFGGEPETPAYESECPRGLQPLPRRGSVT